MTKTGGIGDRIGRMPAVVLALAVLALAAVAAEIRLKSGEVVRGSVQRVQSDSVTIKTQYGTIVVPEADVAEIVYNDNKARRESVPESKEEYGKLEKDRQAKEPQTHAAAGKRRSEWYMPFSYSSSGLWSIGLGHRKGVADDAYREIELDYGRWAAEGWTYEYLLLPVSAVYGPGVGRATPWWKVLAGVGGRVAIGLEVWSVGSESHSQAVLIPSVLAVVKVPLLWVEGSISYASGQALYGVRVQTSFGELCGAMSGNSE